MFIQKSRKCVALTFILCCSTFFIISKSDFGLIRRTFLLFSSESTCTFINDTDIVLEIVKTVSNCENNFARFKFKRKGDYWVAYNYVISTKRFKCQESVTYVTHSDFTFLNNLIPLVERWRGPISVAVYTPGSDFNPTLDTILYLRSCIPLMKEYVTFHLYFQDEHFPEGGLPSYNTVMNRIYNCSLDVPYKNINKGNTYAVRYNLTYPVNLGRNIARSTSETHFVLTSDIELYPSSNLIPRFLEMVAECNMFISKHYPVAFALQVFEVKDGVDVPNNKKELLPLIQKEFAIPFHRDICPQCHTIPKTVEWLLKKENERMRVFYITKRKGRYHHWEPFYIGTKADPDFDERLSWEGMSDKIVQAYAMCLLDYSFLILDNAFLVHRPGIKVLHPEEREWRRAYINETTTLINNVIIPEMHHKYGHRHECDL